MVGEIALQAHEEEVHNKPKPEFDCRICGKYFTTRQNVQRHVKSVHLHIKSFECDSCTRQFTHKEHYVKHISKCNNVSETNDDSD